MSNRSTKHSPVLIRSICLRIAVHQGSSVEHGRVTALPDVSYWTSKCSYITKNIFGADNYGCEVLHRFTCLGRQLKPVEYPVEKLPIIRVFFIFLPPNTTAADGLPLRG